jgi:hypothetical protein
MRKAIFATILFTVAVAPVLAQTAPKPPPSMQRMLNGITEDDSQVILVMNHNGAEVRLATEERPPE